MFKIGPYTIDTPYFLAPMAGVSEMPFRVIAFEYGAGLATTELISAKGLFHKNARTLQYLTHNKEVEKPYSLQLFGGEEDSMSVAAVEAVKSGAQIIDINMGCPVKKVTKTGAGSSLLCNPNRAANLVKKMRETINDAVPITVKIRSGWDADSLNYEDMGKALEDAGCAALALHARTRAQGYSGKADWNAIARLKKAVKMPVIGNGDVTSAAQALQMREETGCDAVMIGRGALGNPWIFYALKNNLIHYAPTVQERLELVLRHLNAHIAFHQMLERAPHYKISATLKAIRTFRSHLVWYSRGIAGAAAFREHMVQCEDLNELIDTIHKFFITAQQKSLCEDNNFDEAIDYRQAFG